MNDEPRDPSLHRAGACACGEHHPVDLPAASSTEAAFERTVEEAAVRAILPDPRARRAVLAAVGRGTLLAALSGLFPLGAVKALAQDRRAPEKKDVKIGFVPITCATPLIMAGPMGFYEREGLAVSLMKTASWAIVRDKVLNREFDASHILSVQPLAISLGLGSQAQQLDLAAIQNVNGNAITLHLKHKDKRDPKTWKGMKFGIPFEYSMHNLLLRYFLAEHGLDPDKDVELRVMPPPDFVANLKAGNVDGGIFAEPFNQRAVFEETGYIHTLTRDIWPGHPCCAFGVSRAFVKENPNTFAAMFRAIANAAQYARKAENRGEIIKAIAPANYLNQPIPVLEQVMTGRYADGLGNVKSVPDRIDFDPFPWQSMAVWMLTQLKRWGYLKTDVDYRQVAESVFLATDARSRMAELGQKPPATNYMSHTIMGKAFDAARPDDYLRSFALRRA